MCKELWNIRWSCEWCWWNFWKFYKTISKSLIWIHFHNPQIEHNTQVKNLKIYEEFPRLDKKQWTPIEYKIVKIKIRSNPPHTITRIQFPIQLATTCTIHRSQGLTLDCLAFDSTIMTKHGLTYIALSKVHWKKNCIYFSHYWVIFFKWIILLKKKCFNF